MAIDIAKDVAHRTSGENEFSIAKKVLDGRQVTREEIKSLAAAALKRDGEEGETGSLAEKVVSGSHQPTPEEMKNLAASVHLQELSLAIDRVRKVVAGDRLLSRSDKNKIIKYLDAIEAISQQYDPDREALHVLLGTLRKFALHLTKKIGENLAVARIFDLLDHAHKLLPI
jgi:hypothetical protein